MNTKLHRNFDCEDYHSWFVYFGAHVLNLFLKTRVTCTFFYAIITVLYIYCCNYQFASKSVQRAAQILLNTSNNYAIKCMSYAIKKQSLFCFFYHKIYLYEFYLNSIIIILTFTRCLRF